MTYETMVSITQTTALLFFLLLFVCVVAYAFWPGNRSRFERAANLPLEGDETGNRRAGS
ncbi:MAG: cbb3-type cytochrome c oxidase subunit 3 [Pseudomonadota bacterium]|nr:cbb3-type cytochrome c oxidase subunit 3 [Pseudomonadota bacterium]